MVDPHRELVLISDASGVFNEKTGEVAECTISADGRAIVVYRSKPKPYPYGPGRVIVLRGERVALPEGTRVEVEGATRRAVTEVVAFTDVTRGWTRIFYSVAGGQEGFSTYPSSKVRFVEGAGRGSRARELIRYLSDVLSRLPDDDPLHRVRSSLDFVHPDSALARFLNRAPIQNRGATTHTVFPFERNLSQWQAIENATTFPLSVIEGPPGTGKTETILNLVAGIVAADAGTVGVVSFSNAAVENVRAKLDAGGLGDIVASLGNKEKRATFFAAQRSRNARIIELATAGVATDSVAAADRLEALDAQLRQLYQLDRKRAEMRNSAAAFRLEREHFISFLQRHEAPELPELPLLERSSQRILRYLAETHLDREDRRIGLVRRVRRYFIYGSLRGLDPRDTDAVLRLQEAFYDERIRELDDQLSVIDKAVRKANFDSMKDEHRRLSVEVLRASLVERYRSQTPRIYSEDDYRQPRNFKRFVHDYPVLLSTCHSLGKSLAEGYLLDYLVIDEASQLDLLTAVAALGRCRNVIVVGDLRQLAQIDTHAADDLDPPYMAYDYRNHSILSSLTDLYGDDLPRTLLREHYRCDPAIIGFCNRMFYDGQLVAFTKAGSEQSMVIVPTVLGNHMRQHRSGGRTNQRELDVIVEEVKPQYCRGVPDADIGITTPYRKQVEKAADVLDRNETDTVHRFQGRQKRVVILSAVIDNTWRGRTGQEFVDDPRLVNVAVSRAVERFILVVDHSGLPTSRYLRDLIAYVRYQYPGVRPPESQIVSVFDLLYREYSDALIPLARRVGGESAYLSENIIETLLTEVLQEEAYSRLTVARQVLVRNLLLDLRGLTPAQESYVRHRASVDFVVYNQVTNDPVLAIEVDGFAFHENNPQQIARDALKNDILRQRGLPLLRLATTGSGEEARIRQALVEVQAAAIPSSSP